MADDGVDDATISQILSTSRATVRRWQDRFKETGLSGLADAPRTGAPRRIPEADVVRLVEALAVENLHGSRISTRRLARQLRISATSLKKLCLKNGLVPLLQIPHADAADRGHANSADRGTDTPHVCGIYRSRRLNLIVTSFGRPGRARNTGTDEPGDAMGRAVHRDGSHDRQQSVMTEARNLKDFLNRIDDDGDLHSHFTAHVRYLKGPLQLVVEEWIATRDRWNHVVGGTRTASLAISDGSAPRREPGTNAHEAGSAMHGGSAELDRFDADAADPREPELAAPAKRQAR